MQSTTVLDTKAFDARARDALVLSLFEGLKTGESFVVLTAADGEDLCRQLTSLSEGNLKWEFLDKGSAEWRLRIEKLDSRAAKLRQEGGCCGCCGG